MHGKWGIALDNLWGFPLKDEFSVKLKKEQANVGSLLMHTIGWIRQRLTPAERNNSKRNLWESDLNYQYSSIFAPIQQSSKLISVTVRVRSIEHEGDSLSQTWRSSTSKSSRCCWWAIQVRERQTPWESRQMSHGIDGLGQHGNPIARVQLKSSPESEKIAPDYSLAPSCGQDE